MPRSPSLPHNYEESSSLDPLADSFDACTSPAATRSSSPAKHRLSSPDKSSTRKRSSSDRRSIQSPQNVSILAHSPSRRVTEQTLSPWKIRVTVETEPENAETPVKMSTRTTKIPLRQSSSPTPVEPSGRRGRTPQLGAAKSKRSGTPVRGKHGSSNRSRRQSVTDLDIVVLGDDGDSDEWTAKQRSPRKKRSSSKGRSKSASVDPEGMHIISQSRADRGSFDIHEDEEDGISIHNELEQANAKSPELRQIDLNRVSVRSRPQSIKQKEEPEHQQEKRPTDRLQASSLPKSTQSSTRKVSANSAMSYPTPSPTSSYHGDSDEVDKVPETTDHQEGFDTIMESEGFTMIDLDTVPSARQFLSTPSDAQSSGSVSHPSPTNHVEGPPNSARNQQQVNMAPSIQPSPIPKYLATLDEESELSSNVPSSPPVIESSMLQVPKAPSSGLRKVTPLQYSSPKLPSPPRPVRKSPRSHRRTMSKEAVTAGMVLQEVVSPEKAALQTPSSTSSQEVSSSNEERLYGGFSSGTKRELRAGLRFGEELAKRQKPTSLVPTAARQDFRPSSKTELDRLPRPSTSTQVWRGEALIRHSSPLASNGHPQRKSDMPNIPAVFDPALSTMQKLRTKESQNTIFRTETPKPSSRNVEPERSRTDARRQHEWQLERQAVSREVEKASPSKVIVIDSDDDEQEDIKPAPVIDTVDKNGKAEECSELEYDRLASRRSQRYSSEAAETGPVLVELHEKGTRLRSDDRSRMSDAERNDEGDEGGDIWLAEAKAGSSSPRDPNGEVMETLFTRSENQHQREQAVEVVAKPRRSLLPSPWKRGEDVEASTFMSTGETSGMLWQQPPSNKFGDGYIAQTKRQLSSGGSATFDLERMLSSPVKLARSGRQASMELRIDQGYPDLEESDEDEKGAENAVDDQDASVHEGNQDESSQLLESEYSMPSSPPKPTRILVKFNDSTLSHQTTPPQLTRPTLPENTDERPLTPRSALKGARQSLGVTLPQDSPRKVVISERALYLNTDGVESSMSANLDSPQVEQQHPLYGQHKELEADEGIKEIEQIEGRQDPPRKSGWLGWLWKGKTADDSTHSNTERIPKTAPQLDGTNDSPAPAQQWQPTKTAIASSASQTSRSEESQSKLQKQKSAESTPSYLKPPSYPSDPSRASTTRLATSGEFTNSHFRTLHIIHAKTQRPRFHAPKHIRAGVRSLLGWKMEHDMTNSDMDVFEWRAGQTECEVIERFMQEIEWSHVQAGLAEKMGDVTWEWQVEELARHLGMIVIGEVVRKEERMR